LLIPPKKLHKKPIGLPKKLPKKRGDAEEGNYRRINRVLSEDSVVIGVAPDPEPEKSILHFNCQRSIMDANADRAVFSDLLEVQRGVSGVFL